jgi:hypothetical protein
MSLTLGVAMACQVGSAIFFCLIFCCDDNIGYLNKGYKVTQSVNFIFFQISDVVSSAKIPRGI